MELHLRLRRWTFVFVFIALAALAHPSVGAQESTLQPNLYLPFVSSDSVSGTGRLVIINPGLQIPTLGSQINFAIDLATPSPGTVTFSATELPDGIILDPATGILSGTIEKPGTYASTVTVRDQQDNVANATFAWSILPAENQPPLLHPPDQTTLVGTALQLEIVAQDLDGDALTYTIAGQPVGLSIDTTSGIVSGSPTTHRSREWARIRHANRHRRIHAHSHC